MCVRSILAIELGKHLRHQKPNKKSIRKTLTYRAHTSTKVTTTRVRVIKMKALFITYANTRATIIEEVRPRRALSVIPEDGGA